MSNTRWLHLPRVDDSQTSNPERVVITGGYSQPVSDSTGCKISVCRANRHASCAGLRHQFSVGVSTSEVEGQDSSDEQRKDALLQVGLRCNPALSGWEQRDAGAQFSHGDRREVKCFQRLRTDSGDDAEVWHRTQWLRHYVCIK